MAEPLSGGDMLRVTPDEVRRIERTVRTRLNLHQLPGVVGVGIGQGLEHGRPDKSRPIAIRVVVKQKRPEDDLPAGQRLPSEIKVRVRRGDRFDTLTLPIDVVETKSVELTAAVVLPASVTTNALIRFRETSDVREWGFLTVQHGFRDPIGFELVIKPPDEEPFNALRWRATPGHFTDAAIIGLATERALDFFRIDQPEAQQLPSTDREVRPSEQVLEDALAKRTGASLRNGGPVGFVAEAYFKGPIELVPGFRAVKHVLVVRSDLRNAFEPGTSGSLWMIGGQVAAMQFAAEGSDYRVGFGLTVESILEAMLFEEKAIAAMM